ncbi:helix-turn-helix domain-containing protein [Leucobacter denitrificans]|uniref:Helix-turn-helix domain-containing protein n=1 Tax=Leucobacter denitrificans TaxID=683042 RepID=A0A7G9S3C9_9MICO|nr:helix-turn-helix domain-containing protein [Leucobacter denitrificans]QNN62354.1 helix-turn-helix domain-containing protein [Leucobacter denitrificans]
MTLSARNWAWDVNRFNLGNKLVRDLKPGEKLTLLAIAESENAEYGYAFPSYDYLAQMTCQSVRTIQTHVKTLEHNNAFKIEKRKSRKGKWLNNVYVLNVPETYRAKDPEWQRYQDGWSEARSA